MSSRVLCPLLRPWCKRPDAVMVIACLRREGATSHMKLCSRQHGRRDGTDMKYETRPCIYKACTSYFFPMPDNRPATAFYRERRHSEAPRSIMPTSCHDGSGTILSGLMCCTFLYAAKVRKFFFLRRVRRSQQLPAAISCRPKLSPRREKKADVSVQSRGQMDGRHCGVCGNRIYSAAAIWTCYARTHPSNFVSALPAVPTVVQRTFARFGRVSSSCAHGAGRGGGAVVPWHGGTDCTCLWPRRSQREATAARCHSRVHTVWDRKKGRFRR